MTIRFCTAVELYPVCGRAGEAVAAEALILARVRAVSKRTVRVMFLVNW